MGRSFVPTVISYDSPALMAALAGNVSNARGQQQQFEDDQQQQKLALAAQQQRQQYQLQQQQMALQASEAAGQYNLRAQAGAPAPTPAWTEGGGGAGPTIYHPAGEQQLPPQQLAQFDASHNIGQNGGAGPIGAVGGGGGGAGGMYHGGPSAAQYGHLPVQQQKMMQRIDGMAQQGYLTPAEAERWKGIAEQGGDPFSQRTAAEELASHAHTSQLTPAQEAQQARQAKLDEQKADESRYNVERNRIRDQITSMERRLKDADSDSRAGLLSKIEAKEKELEELPEKLAAQKRQPGPAGAGPATNPPPNKAAPGGSYVDQVRAAGRQLTATPGANGQTVIGNGAAPANPNVSVRSVPGPANNYGGINATQAAQLIATYGSKDAARQAIARFGSFDAALKAAQTQQQ